MRRSIDDQVLDGPELPGGLDDATPVTWAVAVCDDYEDAAPRIVLTVDPVGAPGTGLVAHLAPPHVRRLMLALRDAMREIGEPVDDGGVAAVAARRSNDQREDLP